MGIYFGEGWDLLPYFNLHILAPNISLNIQDDSGGVTTTYGAHF
jgi:hypothetical protein